MYAFLKGYKGFKKVENYIQKVWQVEQAYHHPAPDAKWKPTREDLEQYEIDRERVRELQDSYKTVERIVGERDDKRDGERTTQFLVKWTSEFLLHGHH